MLSLGGTASAFARQADDDAGRCKPGRGPARSVIEVIDAETVRLDNNQRVRLIGALAPRPPHHRSRGVARTRSRRDPPRNRPYDPDRARALASSLRDPTPIVPHWAPDAAARRMLAVLVAGRSVRLRRTPAGKDRYGRLLAHMFVVSQSGEDDLWVQQAMVAAGHARAYSFVDARMCTASLMAAEARARRGKRGLWRHAAYAVRRAARPAEFEGTTHTFQIAEGRIESVGRARGKIYLNFGGRWKTDFTLVISGRARQRFIRAGLNLEGLKGRRVRARGWVTIRNGPMIRLSHPEQLEILPQRRRQRPALMRGPDEETPPPRGAELPRPVGLAPLPNGPRPSLPRSAVPKTNPDPALSPPDPDEFLL